MRQLSPDQRTDLLRLAERPDHKIDLTEIPEIRQLPADAVIGKFYRPKKQSVTIRLDS